MYFGRVVGQGTMMGGWTWKKWEGRVIKIHHKFPNNKNIMLENKNKYIKIKILVMILLNQVIGL